MITSPLLNRHVPQNQKMHLHQKIRCIDLVSFPCAAELSVFICVCVPSIMASGMVSHVLTYLEAAFTPSHTSSRNAVGV